MKNAWWIVLLAALMIACGTVKSEGRVAKECSVSSECSRGEICSSQGRCITECRAKRDCPDDEVCDEDGECVEAEPRSDDDVDNDVEPDAGPAPECDSDSDCAADGNPCTDSVCEDGDCVFDDNQVECVVNRCIGVCTNGACMPHDCQPDAPTAELEDGDLKISGPLHLFGGEVTVAQAKFLCVVRWPSELFECAAYTAGRSTFVPLEGGRRFTPFACTVDEGSACTLPTGNDDRWAFLADGWRAVDPVAIVDDRRGTGDLVMVIVE